MLFTIFYVTVLLYFVTGLIEPFQGALSRPASAVAIVLWIVCPLILDAIERRKRRKAFREGLGPIVVIFRRRR